MGSNLWWLSRLLLLLLIAWYSVPFVDRGGGKRKFHTKALEGILEDSCLSLWILSLRPRQRLTASTYSYSTSSRVVDLLYFLLKWCSPVTTLALFGLGKAYEFNPFSDHPLFLQKFRTWSVRQSSIHQPRPKRLSIE